MKGFSVLNPLFHKDGRPLLNTDFAHYYQRIRSKQKREALLWSLGLVVLYWAPATSPSSTCTPSGCLFRTSSTTGRNHSDAALASAVRRRAHRGLAGLLGLPSEYPAAADLGDPAAGAGGDHFLGAGGDRAGVSGGRQHLYPGLGAAGDPHAGGVLRTMPELAWAVMFVMAFGIGAIPGFRRWRCTPSAA